MDHLWTSREVDGGVDWYTETTCTVCGIHQGDNIASGHPFGYLSPITRRFDVTNCRIAQEQLRAYLDGRLDEMDHVDVGCVPIYLDALRAGYNVADVLQVMLSLKRAWPADVARAFKLPVPAVSDEDD